jgi:hypothetical protein
MPKCFSFDLLPIFCNYLFPFGPSALGRLRWWIFQLLETVPKKSENSYKQTTTRQSRNQNKNNSS